MLQKQNKASLETNLLVTIVVKRDIIWLTVIKENQKKIKTMEEIEITTIIKEAIIIIDLMIIEEPGIEVNHVKDIEAETEIETILEIEADLEIEVKKDGDLDLTAHPHPTTGM